MTILISITGGITIATMAKGSQSAPYYAAVSIAGLVATTSILRQGMNRSLLPGVLGILLIALVYIMQALTFPLLGSDFDATNSFFRVASIVIIFTVCVALANMRPSALDKAFISSWAFMFAVLIYGIVVGGALRIEIGDERFSGAGLREVIWAEVALGTLVLAFLTRKLEIFIITIPVVTFMILATQMRTIGIAALIAVLIYSSHYLFFQRSKIWKAATIIFCALALIYMILLSDTIATLVRNFLLLDDAFRGLESGFSGRLDTIVAGWASYLASPFIGSGLIDEHFNSTHNGYVLLLEQYGIFAYFWFSLILTSLYSAIRRKDIIHVSCIVALMLYYVGQPRHINFQLFPFVGVLSVFLALAARSQRSSIER